MEASLPFQNELADIDDITSGNSGGCDTAIPAQYCPQRHQSWTSSQHCPMKKRLSVLSRSQQSALSQNNNTAHSSFSPDYVIRPCRKLKSILVAAAQFWSSSDCSKGKESNSSSASMRIEKCEWLGWVRRRVCLAERRSFCKLQATFARPMCTRELDRCLCATTPRSFASAGVNATRISSAWDGRGYRFLSEQPADYLHNLP